MCCNCCAVQATQEKNRISSDMNELRDHLDIKDRKISVLQRKIENLEDLLKEKDNQVDIAKSRLTQVKRIESFCCLQFCFCLCRHEPLATNI